MSDKELAEAMDAAIASAGGAAATPTEDDDAGTDTTDAQAADQPTADGEAAASDDQASGGAAAAGAEDGAGDAADEGADRGAAGAESGAAERDPKTGRFRSKAADAGAAPEGGDGKPGAKPAAGAPAKPGAPKPDAKAPDHVNDPLPDDVKGRTRERMQGLITQAKALTSERDTIKAEHSEFLDAIAATGADAETFWRHTEVLQLMLSEDPGEQRRAIKFLRGAADRLALGLGDDVPGHDPLKDAANQDLLDEVESGDLSRERALELARARSQTAASTRRANETEQQRQAREAHEQAVDTAREELNTLGEELKRANPTVYAAKTALLIEAVKEMVKYTPPAKWATAYKAMYDKLPAPGPARSGNRAPRGTGTNQPSRPTQGAGGGGPQAPQNAVEAFDLGLAAMNRR